ncbi:MAG: lysophospholipid acyltransferase family protein [Chthoniobacteraceae bacterium]|nr:lysophospholipid acyltransferase family protein [Chthoniobacteraceae bacterium]
MRALAWTLRWRVDDRCGITRPGFRQPIIGVFWHNRILAIPLFYRRFCPGRRGHCLTSPSKDGAIIAGVMQRFRVGSVRGSSSRRGSTAVREMAAVLAAGGDMAITPDGPRGPIYRLHPGVIKLAQISGALVMPVHVAYSRYWELKSWDAFRIPKPFARVHIVLGEPYVLSPDLDAEAFEAARAGLETVLNQEPSAAAPANLV